MYYGICNYIRKGQGAGKMFFFIYNGVCYTWILFHTLQYITDVKNVIYFSGFSLCRDSLFCSFLTVVCGNWVYSLSPLILLFIIIVISRKYILTNWSFEMCRHFLIIQFCNWCKASYNSNFILAVTSCKFRSLSEAGGGGRGGSSRPWDNWDSPASKINFLAPVGLSLA